ncbi:hypothetical protein [Streptomyces endophytica]|uniref:Uncharacterized protein n=1 Tax=Streptomyces endophytica TaxID=2991496 RepID=A0ABY6PBP1_9ACTN|nr:hypothetical protein [Streptomyces endophytica]UZJ30622.1 hypothetical protein OJ254_09955 [Streptomyces endophytica]
MTYKTGMAKAMNGTELKTSAGAHEVDTLALIREMTAMACRLAEEVRALRQDMAELREDREAA